MKAAGIPLRTSNDRVVLYGTMLALIASAPFIIFPSWFHDVAYRGDFANFWSAGSNVGTTRLLDAAALAVWQTAHGITAAGLRLSARGCMAVCTARMAAADSGNDFG